MNRRRRKLVTSLLLIGAAHWKPWPPVAAGREAMADAYRRACAQLAAERRHRLERWRAGERSAAFLASSARRLVEGIMHLAEFWMGTRWGLGSPQIERPGDGRVNCGTFVGRLLADAGFRVNVRALQMQASELIASTFAPPEHMRRFSRVPLPLFIATVLRMGPGLFVIGLDQHVGLLVNLGGEAGLRFVHASYLTETVVDEPAAHAPLIQGSRYRVVGKMLGRRNLDQWLRALPIPVHGGLAKAGAPKKSAPEGR